MLGLWTSGFPFVRVGHFHFCLCFFACFKYLRTKNNVNPPHLLNSTLSVSPHQIISSPEAGTMLCQAHPSVPGPWGGQQILNGQINEKREEKCKHMTFQGNFWSR